MTLNKKIILITAGLTVTIAAVVGSIFLVPGKCQEQIIMTYKYQFSKYWSSFACQLFAVGTHGSLDVKSIVQKAGFIMHVQESLFKSRWGHMASSRGEKKLSSPKLLYANEKYHFYRA